MSYLLPNGAFVFCDLFGFEHSGITTTGNCIIELERDGIIKRSSCEQFLRGTGGRKIYVAGYRNRIILDPVVAAYANQMVSSQWRYHFMFQNCHNFVARTITHDPDCNVRYFHELHRLIAEIYHCPHLGWRTIYSAGYG